MNNHGHREDGTPITDADVEVMADEAEHGYDVETLLRRRPGGRPPLGSGTATTWRHSCAVGRAGGRPWDQRQPVSSPCGWTRNSNVPC